ncbi:hypothetical protein H7H82_01030 [Mycobacterium heidelbergense]|nr:hypothetical protein [Mycobacterium heidelbergense]MCV7049205.1 hypothetical protein [Mycobacterium heidelbergense]
MSTNVGPSTTAALNDGALSTCGGGVVLDRGATGVDRAAATERGTFLAEDLAVRPAAGSPGDGAARALACASSRDGTAEPAGRSATAGGVAAQACTPSNGRGRRLGRRVAAKGAAVAAQNRAASLATDAQSSAARRAGARLATDTNTREWAGDVRRSGTVHRSTFAGDQSRLTARAGAERRVAAGTGEATDIACTCQPSACGKTGLSAQTTAASNAGLANERGLGAGTSTEPALSLTTEGATGTEPTAGQATEGATGPAASFPC